MDGLGRRGWAEKHEGGQRGEAKAEGRGGSYNDETIIRLFYPGQFPYCG
jgi:hypothetical protein